MASFDELLADPIFGSPTPNAPVEGPAATPDPFAGLAVDIEKPAPGDPSIFNALPRGLNSVRQGSNLSWFAAQRLAGGAPDALPVIDSLAQADEFDKLYPKTEAELDAERKFFQESDWSQLLSPKFVAGAALESLPSMVGPIIGSIGGGLAGAGAGSVIPVLGTAAGGVGGAIAGGGAGSGIIDYGASYKDYLTKKLGPFNREKWLAAFQTDPNLLDEAHHYAAKHSSMVAAFDMIGMKVGGKLAAPLVNSAVGRGVGGKIGSAAGGIAVEGATEFAGEATGSGLASGGEDWNIKEAVLGGVAAMATGGAQSFVEPVAKRMLGAGPTQPVQDADLEAAFAGFTPVQPVPPGQDNFDLIAADPLIAQPMAASVAAPQIDPVIAEAVVERGPSAAEPEQWIERLRRDFTEEELQSTGIENLVQAQTGRVPKSDIVAELETNQVQTEVVDTPQGRQFAMSAAGVPVANVSVQEQVDYDGRQTLHINAFETLPSPAFRTSTPELAFKQMMRRAVDEGYTRISWDSTPNPEAPIDTKTLGSVARKWAKRFGGDYGTTKIDGRDVQYAEVNPAATGDVKRGLSFSQVGPDRLTATQEVLNSTDPAIQDRSLDIRRLGPVIFDLKKRMKLSFPLRIQATTSPNFSNSYGAIGGDGNGGYIMYVNPALHADASTIWGTMLHEFGHAVFFEEFKRAPVHVKAAIRAEYNNFRSSLKPTDSLESLFLRRDAAITRLQREETGGSENMSLYQLTPEARKYWASFDEWAAEQVVKWATTSERPLSVVEKFFKRLANYLKDLFSYMQERGEPAQAVASVESWLNSFLDDAPAITAPIYAAMDERSRQFNENALRADGDLYVQPTEITDATRPVRRAMDILFESKVPPAVQAMAAHADRINKFTEYAIALPQLAKLNPHIRSLQLYRQGITDWQIDKQRMANEAHTTLKGWRKLGRSQADAVAGLIDDMMNMVYLQPNETPRWPTRPEFDNMVFNRKVDAKGLAVFGKVQGDFSRMLLNYEQLLMNEANKIVDPIARFQKQQDITASIQRMQSQPYFPAMRFGDYTITIRDSAGAVIHFETTETKRQQQRIRDELRPQLRPGDEISIGIMPKDAKPLMGMPPSLLTMMEQKLNLSPTQKGMLEELRFELAPQQSFRHRFQRKKMVAGYSQNFMRSFANYFFHGSNHFARLKHADALRDHIKDVREQAKFMPDGVNRGKIANFMADHLQNVLDPKPDFARLRGAIFLWAMGYSPAAAALNLTQTLLVTGPFLASKFGDVKAAKAMTSAGARISSFYKKGTYETMATNPGRKGMEMQAISEAVKTGIISEAMAPELAANSEGRNLGQGFGGNVAERGWSRFLEGAAWMFGMTEQVNRRIAFRAAFNLALDNPGAKHVREVVMQNTQEYQRLRTAGWTQASAAAYVVAMDAVNTTQFEYTAAAQPRVMRGYMRPVLVFKSFVQNTLFFLYNYPTAAIRYFLMMGFLGGLMGLPGSDDLKDILKVLAWQIFGKEFNLELEVRKFVMELSNGTINPDTLLHGMSRTGFGLPQAVDLLSGGTVQLPELDRSRAISMGALNPIPLAGMFGPPQRDESKGVADAIQKASGAAFGVGFNIIKALTDNSTEGLKRWEKAMPRAVASISRAYRVYNDEAETTRNGTPVLRFDVTDTKQMMEILAMAGGYTPTRLAKKWDLVLARMEVEQYWDLRKSGLLKQYWNAYDTPEDLARVKGAIAKFNKDLPKGAEAMAITEKTIERSMDARDRIANRREAGLPTQNSKEGLYTGINNLFPGVEVDVRKVK